MTSFFRRSIPLMLAFLSALILPLTSCSQNASSPPDTGLVISPERLELMLLKPPCLAGFRPNQSGPLSREDDPPGTISDSTFSVQQLSIPSGEIMINAWLYLPPGAGRVPLIVLCNGGGDGSRPIRNFSDWLAPILAHCGYAALVHDKRGTGGSGGIYRSSTYTDYANDAGNCARYLRTHPRIDTTRIGVAGASEGGRVATMAASRFSEITFAISMAGTGVSSIDDRIYAQKGWLSSLSLPDSAYVAAFAAHCASIRAWASGDSSLHAAVDRQIDSLRLIYDDGILPWKKVEMDSIPAFDLILPTWYSLSANSIDELAHFNKPWLAMFGALDVVVPSHESISNIEHYMSLSGNRSCTVVLFPTCGHSPVDVNTRQMIRIDHVILNWLASALP